MTFARPRQSIKKKPLPKWQGFFIFYKKETYEALRLRRRRIIARLMK